jgi:hypothetical protein
MSQKFADYSNTIIYKICCKDETIKDIYVGHTTNFVQRQNAHESACKNLHNNIRIYKIIRSNGGWKNWDMVEIAKYCCKNRTEARIKENEHYNELQASLNSCQPYAHKPKHLCTICNLQFTNLNKYNSHVNSCKKYYEKYYKNIEQDIKENIKETKDDEEVVEETKDDEEVVEETKDDEEIVEETKDDKEIVE